MSPRQADIRLGVTLYSLTNEYHSRQYSFPDLVREVARRGLGPGLEVVGFQSIRGFPEVSDAFADEFRGLIEETGLEPSCLAINADQTIVRDRPMSLADSVAYHERQVEAAAKLGFPLIRFQWGATPEVIERVVPLAEKLNVKMGLEIHAPHSVDHPEVLAYREMYARVGSPCLGFIPDFGASARTVPPAYIEYFRWRKIDPAIVEKALEIWHQDLDPFVRRPTFMEWAKTSGKDEIRAAEVSIIFGLFSRQPPRDWLEIMDQVVHVHGKFYGIDASGEDPCVDYEATLPVFVEGGYRGYISTEWEGHQVSDADGFQQVADHHALERRILGMARAA